MCVAVGCYTVSLSVINMQIMVFQDSCYPTAVVSLNHVNRF